MKEEKKTNSSTKSTSANKKKSGTTVKKNSTRSTTKKGSSSVTAKKDVKKKSSTSSAKVTKKETLKEPKVSEVKEVVSTPKQKEYKPIVTLNYMTVVAVLLAVVLVVLVLAKMYGTAQNIDYSKSYLAQNEIVSEIACADLLNAVSGHHSFIYIPLLGSEEEYNLEKNLAKLIKTHHLEKDFYIADVSSFQCGSLEDVTSELGESLKLEEGIKKTPVILYYQNGELTEVITREDEAMINDGDFLKVLDMYEIR